ncbi:MAG: hypothetical protein HY736_15420, partial [Verrucomicrobia bacterium]|nr:hypothetical protein [Verrucomicrobiota bacterium]
IKVVPIDDNVIELQETEIVSISAEARYQTGPRNIATVAILANDLLPLPLL